MVEREQDRKGIITLDSISKANWGEMFGETMEKMRYVQVICQAMVSDALRHPDRRRMYDQVVGDLIVPALANLKRFCDSVTTVPDTLTKKKDEGEG